MMKRKSLLFLLLFALIAPWAAQAQETLTVCDEGTTTSNSYVPFYGLYADTQGAASECVIPSDMLSDMAGGTISEMKFYITSAAAEAWTGTHQVYVGEVDATTLTGITGPSAFTVVQTASFDATGTELTVTFDAPYTYGGGNLLIGTYVSVAGNWKSAYFAGISQENNTGWYRSSASADGSGVKFLPKTTFTYTPAASDCDMPTSIAVSNVTADGATVTWEGEGDTWNLRYKASTDADFTLVEGLTTQTYTFDGTLAGNTTYSVGVQTVCTGSTSFFKSTSFTTENPCAAPTNFVASNVTANSATISWTAGYQETTWTVKYKKSADSWDNAAVVTVSGTPTTSLTGLDGLTVYNVRVFNCTGENDPYLSGNFTTGAFFPYSQDFTGSTSIPAGWSRYSGLLADVLTGTALTSTSYGWSNGTSNGVLDGNHLYANIYSTGCNKWIVTPAIPVESGARLTFDVAYTAFSGTAADPQTTGTDDKFVVLISTDNMATWTILRQWDNAGSEYVLNDLTPAALHQVFDLADYAGQNTIVAFYAESTESNADNNIHVDNVVFELIPSCEKPTELSVENNMFDATFTWSSDAASFDVAYSTDNTANPVDVIVATVNTTSYEFTNLALGDHYVWVRANCSATEQSEWAGPINIHIGYCVPAPTSVDNNGISNVTFGIGDGIVNNNTTMGSNVATYLDYTSLTGTLQAGLQSTVSITYATGYTYGTIIWVDFDNSLSFEESEIIYMGTSTGSNPTTLNATFVIPATVTPGNYVMRIGGADSNFDGYIAGTSTTAPDPCYTGTWACFQDYTLRVLEAPACLPVTGLTASNATVHTVDLAWTAGGDETAWVVAYKTAEEEEFTEVAASSNPYTLSGLRAETTYTLKVAADCGEEQSVYSDVITITTAEPCPAPTDLSVEPATVTADVSFVTGNESVELWWREMTDPNNDFETSNLKAWKSIDADGDGYGWVVGAEAPGIYHSTNAVVTGNGHNSSYDFVISGSYSNVTGVALTPDNYLVSPQINLGGSITFWAQAQDANYPEEHFGVAVSTTGINPSDFTMLEEWTMTAKSRGAMGNPGMTRSGNRDTGAWYEYTVDLSEYSGRGYVAIRHFNCTDQFLLNVDDIVIVQPDYVEPEWNVVSNATNPYTITGLAPETAYEVQVRNTCGEDGNSEWLYTMFFTLPLCEVPTKVDITDVTTTSAVVTWESEAASFDVELDGDVIAADVTETTYTINDLDPGTFYTVRVRANCGDNGYSSYTTAITFATECEAYDLPYEYGFENADDMACWSVLAYNSDNVLGRYTLDEAYEGNYIFVFSSYNSSDYYDQVLVSPELNSGDAQVAVEFSYLVDGYGTETFDVMYSTTTADLDAFEVAESIEASNTEEWMTYQTTLPAGTKYVCLWYYSNYSYYLYVDAFSFTEVSGVTQTTDLYEGWNLFSSYIAADGEEGAVTLLDMLKESLGENGIKIMAENAITEYEDEEWFGDLDEIGLENEVAYYILVSADCTAELEGMPANPADYEIEIHSDWNQIGFPSAVALEVADALSEFEAEEGDLLQDMLNHMTEFDGEEWFGDLEEFEPGQGYMYYSTSEDTKVLVYQTGTKVRRAIPVAGKLQRKQAVECRTIPEELRVIK